MQTTDTFFQFHAFDYVPATWGFLRERFARQCKALKKVSGRSTAQCYDLIARSTGFSTWGAMGHVMTALEAIERYGEDLFGETPRSARPDALHLALRTSMAFGTAAKDFWLQADGRLDGHAVEAVLARARRRPLPASLEEEAVLDGLETFAEIRFALCAQATWCGQTHIVSQVMMDTLAQAHEVLAPALGNDDLASAALRAMYGDYAEWSPELDLELQLIDNAARVHLTGGRSTLEADLAQAYALADEGCYQPVATWRQLLREAAPNTLDITAENGPLTSLVLNNAPADAVVWVRLVDLELERGLQLQYFVTDGQIWVPTADGVAQAAACSGSPPQHTLAVTADIQQHYNLPTSGGYLLTWD